MKYFEATYPTVDGTVDVNLEADTAREAQEIATMLARAENDEGVAVIE